VVVDPGRGADADALGGVLAESVVVELGADRTAIAEQVIQARVGLTAPLAGVVSLLGWDASEPAPGSAMDDVWRLCCWYRGWPTAVSTPRCTA